MSIAETMTARAVLGSPKPTFLESLKLQAGRFSHAEGANDPAGRLFNRRKKLDQSCSCGGRLLLRNESAALAFVV